MRANIFGAQLLTLPQIFDNNLFTIPDYQRGYAWDEKQVRELLRDIDHLLDDGISQKHYTGTIVLSLLIDDITREYQVVDGQQRLTTLVILLRMLADRLSGDQKTAFEWRYLRRGEPGADRSVLLLSADTRSFFERVIMGDGNPVHEPPTLEAHHRLLQARKLISNWISDRTSIGTSIAQFLDSVEKELGFIVFAPKEDAETGAMFEVINNRGKPLSELEKVKNYLIYCCVKLNATTLRKSIDGDWSEILRNLNVSGKTSQSDEGAFLRYCMSVYFKLNKTDSQYGYDEIKKKVSLEESIKSPARKTSAVTEIGQFVSFLKAASLWYARLYGQKHDSLSADLVAVLDQIRGQDRQASIMPIFLALVIKNQGAGGRLVKLLKLLEVVNFRVYMARNITARNDTGQGDLYYYAYQYYHDQLLNDFDAESRKIGSSTVATEEDALEYRLVQFALWLAPEDPFKKSFSLEAGSADDFYDWRGLRYFLMSYEQHLQPNKTILIDKITRSRSEGKSADYLSVEHLWATENRNNPGENDRVVDSFEKRRLGNFVLLELRLNIQGYADNLEDKLPRYIDEDPSTELVQVRKMAKVAKSAITQLNDRNRTKNYYLELHRAINEKLEEGYVKFAQDRWSLSDFMGYGKIKKGLELVED